MRDVCSEAESLKIRINAALASSRLTTWQRTFLIDMQTRLELACAPGAEGTDRCNYGRSCGILRSNGEDVGKILISEGLAAPYICGATACPPPPRPWCG